MQWCLNENENFTANDTLMSRGTTLTLEHVLPQKPEKASEWMSMFPDKDEREMWTNKLSNLTLINGKRNAPMSNNDYAKKETRAHAQNLVQLSAQHASISEARRVDARGPRGA